MLASHSRLCCGPESGFFSRFNTLDVNHLCDPRTWPRPAIDYLYAIETLDKPIPEDYGFSREQIERYLQARRPSVPAILESLTEQYMNQVGKRRWVEKTPTHCVHVAAIRRFFPTSPIIRIVRDPRDVALSLLKQSWGPESMVEAIWRWRAYETISVQFCQTDRYALTIRYEDLLRAPEAKMKEVCEFIGERFEPGMLDTSQSIRHVNKTNEGWKVKAGTPPDPSRIAAWKRTLSDEDNCVFEALLGNHLIRYGYDCRDDFKGFLRVHPEGQSRYFWDVLQEFVSKGYRFWPKARRETPALTIFLDQPGSYGWLPAGRFARFRTAAALSIDVWRSRVSRRPVRWFTGPNEVTNGFCARLLRHGLEPFSTK
jgi:hypothetical protein